MAFKLKSRPCEKFLADFFTTAFLKALEINLLYLSTLKIADGQALRSVEVQKSAKGVTVHCKESALTYADFARFQI